MEDMELQDLPIEELVRRQAVTIARLEQLLSDKSPANPADKLAAIDVNDVRVPYKFAKFPVHVYKRDAKRDKHADHPGYQTKLAHSEKELQQLLAKGWEREYVPLHVLEPVASEDAEADAPVADVPSADAGKAPRAKGKAKPAADAK